MVHFVEWADQWSMGDVFIRWLNAPGGLPPAIIHADRFEVYSYDLPDGGRLGRHLAVAGPQWAPESDQFVGRLREAVGAWEGSVDRAVLVVLREVVGGLTLDEEVLASLSVVPDWLLEG